MFDQEGVLGCQAGGGGVSVGGCDECASQECAEEEGTSEGIAEIPQKSTQERQIRAGVLRHQRPGVAKLAQKRREGQQTGILETGSGQQIERDPSDSE